MSPGERAASGRREPPRPQYAATAPGFLPPYYPPYSVPHPNTWLGAPLISLAGRPPPSRHPPVSKLAIQAQGAPLIIQNKNDRRKFLVSSEQRNPLAIEHNNRDKCDMPDGNRPRNQQQQTRLSRGGRNNNTDAVSVASDESSGSANSETTLPRIIKPRKRRKKDRKPNNVIAHDITIALELSDVDRSMVSASHNIYDESYYQETSAAYRSNSKLPDCQNITTEIYHVSALGEALEATRFGVTEAASPGESAVSSCQCRYCNPLGQIWDANPMADLLNGNSSVDFTPTKLEESMKIVGPLGRRGTDTILRRSWSDPSSRVPDCQEVSEDKNSAPNLYSLFPQTRMFSPPGPRSPLALEISSEIVTSMNGHRDLEIKLFSTSPLITEARSFFADKKASVVNKFALAGNDSEPNNKVNCARAETSVKTDNLANAICQNRVIYRH